MSLQVLKVPQYTDFQIFIFDLWLQWSRPAWLIIQKTLQTSSNISRILIYSKNTRF